MKEGEEESNVWLIILSTLLLILGLPVFFFFLDSPDLGKGG